MINHLTFSVSNLEKSIHFYQHALNAKLLLHGPKVAYLEREGLWIALNLEENIPRQEIHQSYTHTAFSVTEEELADWEKRLIELNVPIVSGRARNPEERSSIYFTDPDGHKFEYHTGTMKDRLRYYWNEKRDRISFEIDESYFE